MWRSTLEDLAKDKEWDHIDKNRNADTAKEHFITSRDKILGSTTMSATKWSQVINDFMSSYCSRLETKLLRELIATAKKPSDMSIRAYVTRIQQLNRYLPYLPSPLNRKYSDDEINDFVARAVPSWNRKLVESGNAGLSNLADITTYYQDLESQEQKDKSRNNNNNNNRNLPRDPNTNRSGHRQNNNNRNRQNNNNNNRNNNRGNIFRENNRNNENNNNNRMEGADNNRNNRYQRNDNYRGNYNNNNRNNNYNRNADHNRRGYDMRNNRNRTEAHRLEDNEDQSVSGRSHVSHRSVETTRTNGTRHSTHSRVDDGSDDEAYLTEEVFLVEEGKISTSRETSTGTIDYRPEVVVSLLQDSTTKRKKVLRALIDTGCNCTILREDLLPSWARENATTRCSHSFSTMVGEKLKTEFSTTVTFNLVQFAPHRAVTHEVVLASGSKLPDMVIGRDLISTLKLHLDYSTEVPSIRWDEMSIPITPRTFGHIEEIFLDKSLLEQAEQRWESHSPSMIAASYSDSPADLPKFLPTHLSPTEKREFHEVLKKRESVYNGALGTLPGKPVELRLKDDTVTPYHGRAFPVPKIHENLIRDEVDRLVKLGVLRKTNESEWAAPSFGIPKKNGQIRFVSDFRQLNKTLRRLPFPLPNPQEIFRTMDGFS
jgi:Retroviral aspartyl protease